MNEVTFILLGATGDLAKRKLIPALYQLAYDKKIDKCLIVGAAREQLTGKECLERGKSFIKQVDEVIWEKLVAGAFYKAIDFSCQEDFVALADYVQQLEKSHNMPGNRLVYLATASFFFCPITEFLGKSGLVKRCQEQDPIWQSIIYEKPFGTDHQSAQAINECIARWFCESQVYRIDHYLTKELVSSLVLVRFTNIIFEPLWKNTYIDHVQIVATETLGLESRGRYYDLYGVLKDVVQNHIMQLLALTAMELPVRLDGDAIREQKTAILKKVRIDDGFLGQYAGYLQESDVAPHSTTPTFACLRFFIDTPRWQGVPFYVKVGKRLEKKNTAIHVVFKQVECTLQEQCSYNSDCLTIQIEPNASFSLQLNTKKPNTMFDILPVDLTFSHNYFFGTTTPEAYEILLEYIIKKDQSISIRFDEIEYSWRTIESIESKQLPLYEYVQLSEGPEHMKAFDKKHGIRWRS